MKLSKQDIVGHRLVGIFELSDELDDDLIFSTFYFTLDNKLSFTFPFNSKDTLASIEIPDHAAKLEFTEIKEACENQIVNLYRPIIDLDFSEPDSVILQLENDFWLSQFTCAPGGVASSIGVFVDREIPEDFDDMTSFWV